MILHKLNSTSETVLNDLEKVINQEDIIVLTEDAVYLPYLYQEKLTFFKPYLIYVLQPDAQMRGMLDRSLNDQLNIKLIDYAKFVDLSCRCDKIISWFE